MTYSQLSHDIHRRALRDQVYDHLLRMLLQDYDLTPGTRLSIDTLARELEVSPTPVREAMVQLERTGLVTREALKGYRVAPPLSQTELSELFDARMMLEITAVHGASNQAEKVSEELSREHEHHSKVAERVLEAHASEGRVPLPLTQEYFQADADFHAVAFRYAQNRYVSEMYLELHPLTHRMRQAAMQGPADVREAVQEHAAIVEAFHSGSQEDMVAAMRAHIEGARDRAIVDSLEST